ncbi:MAG TPA: hypothetical protein H9903_13190 [Candidatus Aquabacterium excrementipullorum]|nr:hypothetical protein [Candidatus Aquabacterium excrementipullorum]
MNKTKTSLSLGSAFLATLTLSAQAGQASFTSQTLDKGYQVAAADMAKMENDGASAPMDPKHADGKCGADKAKMGKAKDGSCGASKPHAGKKRADGKCGEGKCGASKPAKAAKKASAPASGM